MEERERIKPTVCEGAFGGPRHGGNRERTGEEGVPIRMPFSHSESLNPRRSGYTVVHVTRNPATGVLGDECTCAKSRYRMSYATSPNLDDYEAPAVWERGGAIRKYPSPAIFWIL